MANTTTINTVILGASGYTGAELLRLLENHPAFTIVALTADSQAGKPIEQVYPHLRTRKLPALVKHTEVDFTDVQLVFCCLPHGTTQEIIAGLPPHVRIVDLSADFRLHRLDQYKEWYGHEHRAPELQKTAVYGLTEMYREDIRNARLVANPGCYPTCSLLPLLPLADKAGLLNEEHIIIHAMSGVSGAGRSVKQELLYSEIAGGASAYGIGRHRHMAEIEQELGRVFGKYWKGAHQPSMLQKAFKIEPKATYDIKVDFTPHLVPLTRGMMATISLDDGIGEILPAAEVQQLLSAHYKDEPFVHILPYGSAPPGTHHVRGTNNCFISVHESRRGYLTIISVIDNLVKGASGQALQNANVMFGLPETTNLELTAVFP